MILGNVSNDGTGWASMAVRGQGTGALHLFLEMKGRRGGGEPLAIGDDQLFF
jgi:hypothetical protein